MSQRLMAQIPHAPLAAYAAVATAMSANPAKSFFMFASSSVGVRNHLTPAPKVHSKDNLTRVTFGWSWLRSSLDGDIGSSSNV